MKKIVALLFCLILSSCATSTSVKEIKKSQQMSPIKNAKALFKATEAVECVVNMRPLFGYDSKKLAGLEKVDRVVFPSRMTRKMEDALRSATHLEIFATIGESNGKRSYFPAGSELKKIGFKEWSWRSDDLFGYNSAKLQYIELQTEDQKTLILPYLYATHSETYLFGRSSSGSEKKMDVENALVTCDEYRRVLSDSVDQQKKAFREAGGYK